ncbi:hypothetical protein [endosymbiont GvMRE of Glomus versiforme]|uniref:hypothetical protein n=1 Tax=endosymbiont GvMRE of Glomus versiforme TaxID=2039283 RepID=UPI001FE2820D|nr:hypothetical protein [endosymbiont GvMRE of Glomus versiforme]
MPKSLQSLFKRKNKSAKNKQKQPIKYEQKRQLKQFKDANQELKSIQPQILAEIVRVKVPNAWKKYEEHKKTNANASYPRIKTDKGWYSSFNYPQPIVNKVWVFKIEGNYLIIKQGAKVKKSERELKIPLKLNQPIQREIKTLTISWKSQDEILASFSCEVEKAMGDYPLGCWKQCNFVKWEHDWSLPIKSLETPTSNSSELSRISSWIILKHYNFECRIERYEILQKIFN